MDEPRAGAWTSPRARAAAALVAALVAGELVALGANGPLLAAIAALCDILVATAVLLLAPPPLRFWKLAAPVLLVMAVLLGWAAMPALVSAKASPLFADALIHRIAPDLLLPGLARLAGGCALVVAAGALGYRRGLLRITVDRLILFGVVQMLTGLLLRLVDPTRVWGFDKTIDAHRFTGTMINANANACAAAAFAVLALGRLQALLRGGLGASRRERIWLSFCGGAVLLGVGSCAISGSRTMLAMSILALVALAAADRAGQAGAKLSGGGLLLAGLGIAGLLLLALVGDPTLDRLPGLGGDGADRLAIWGHYLGVARRIPLFGYGLGSFGEVNAATLHDPVSAFLFSYINSAHNELIELVIEGGPVHAILVVALWALLMVTALRYRRAHARDTLLLAVPLAILLIAVEGMVDIALDVPAVAALGQLLLGLWWGHALRVRAQPAAARAPAEAVALRTLVRPA